MKISVITDKAGDIVATIQHPDVRPPDSPSCEVEAGEGQRVHLLNFEPNMSRVKTVDAWHALLRKQIK